MQAPGGEGPQVRAAQQQKQQHQQQHVGVTRSASYTGPAERDTVVFACAYDNLLIARSSNTSVSTAWMPDAVQLGWIAHTAACGLHLAQAMPLKTP